MTGDRWRRWIAPLTGGIIGASFYLWIGGTRLLDPREFTWLMKLDWRIHYLGWHLFRHEPWQWPPGRMESYAYPTGTAIVFTDSIPLLAFLFKPFSAILPPSFQYIGLWLFVCFVLQGVFAILIARIWTRHVWLQLLVAMLFVSLPTLLIRVGHPALCAHFLLLWAVWLYLRDKPSASERAPLAAFAAIGLLAGLLHPYLAIMAMALLAAIVIRDRSAAAIRSFGAATVMLLLAWWASGLFTVSGAENLASEGLGYYSLNLLSPITPSGWSSYLPELPTATGGQQYEGFQYFGAGVLALFVIATVIGLRQLTAWPWQKVMPLAAICFAFALYALSPRVTFGANVVLDVSTAALDRLALFRATGRFFWPLAYLALTVSIAVVLTRLKPLAATVTLAALVALQFADLDKPHSERRVTSRSAEFHAWPTPLPSPVWHQVLPHYRHIVMLPSRQCGSAPLGFDAPAYLAGLHGLTINSAEVARFNEDDRKAYCARLANDLAAGAIDDNSLYIVDARTAAQLKATAVKPAVCGTIDAAQICVTADSYDAWRQLAALN